ncbi:hypothetical protein [Streptomyces sp. NPDC045470]|uniref:hypothetical protein n=1 Tax=Streptomyces sp. NPDC045470 TaxID=3155469 RepID=UPI0004C8E377
MPTGSSAVSWTTVPAPLRRGWPPALEFLRGLWDHPGTALVLAGAGSDRALCRVPALASRALTWELVPRLGPREVATVMLPSTPCGGT